VITNPKEGQPNKILQAEARLMRSQFPLGPNAIRDRIKPSRERENRSAKRDGAENFFGRDFFSMKSNACEKLS